MIILQKTIRATNRQGAAHDAWWHWVCSGTELAEMVPSSPKKRAII